MMLLAIVLGNNSLKNVEEHWLNQKIMVVNVCMMPLNAGIMYDGLLSNKIQNKI